MPELKPSHKVEQKVKIEAPEVEAPEIEATKDSLVHLASARSKIVDTLGLQCTQAKVTLNKTIGALDIAEATQKTALGAIPESLQSDELKTALGAPVLTALQAKRLADDEYKRASVAYDSALNELFANYEHNDESRMAALLAHPKYAEITQKRKALDVEEQNLLNSLRYPTEIYELRYGKISQPATSSKPKGDKAAEITEGIQSLEVSKINTGGKHKDAADSFLEFFQTDGNIQICRQVGKSDVILKDGKGYTEMAAFELAGFEKIQAKSTLHNGVWLRIFKA